MQDQDKTKEQLITELNEMRRKVAELETDTTLDAENAPLSYQSLDENGYFLAVNQAWLDTLGYSREEVIGKWFGDFLAPGYPDHFKINFPRFKAAGEIHGVEFEMVRKDGSIISVAFEGQIARDKWGGFKQTHCIFQDITEQKRAEELLESANAYHRTLIEASVDPLVTISPDGKISDVNTATEKATGYSREELIGTNFSDYFTEPDRAMAGYQQVFHDGLVRDYELEIQHRDGHVTPVICSASVFRDKSGKVVGVFAAARDITERKLAEDALRESEEKFAKIFHYSPVIITLTNVDDGTYIDVNDVFCKLSGLSHQECIGKTSVDLGWLSTEDRMRMIEKLKVDGKIRGMDVKFITKDRGEIHCIYNAELIQANNRQMLLSIGVDITERKRMEEALRASEERFRAVIQNLQIGISVLNPSMEIVAINQFFQKIYPRVQAGTRQLCFESYNDPPRTSPCPYCPCVKTFQDGRVHESLTETPTGSQVRNYRIISCPIKDVQGQVELVVELVEDVTEAKQSEEQNLRLATIVESSDDAIIGKTLDGTITSWNKGAEKIYGYTEHEVVGKPVTILAPHDREDEIKGLLKQIKSGKSVQHLETVRRNKIGDTIPVSLTISPIIDKDGSIVGASTISRDISDRVKAAQQKEALQKQLFQAQKMEAVGTLAGGVAHDFNNLLQAVLGYSELLLQRKKEGEPEYADLQKIYQAGKKGADLVKSLLTFSRKVETKYVPVDLNHEITSVRSLLSRTIPKTIRIDLRLSGSLESIKADQSQIGQVLMNLGVNARDAMPDGGTLTIETSNIQLDEEYCQEYIQSKPGSYVLLMVSDTGQGMDKETLSHIFEPFFSTKEPGKGTGLGLAIVHGIIKEHGGHITCDSEPGLGTTFKIYFPADEEERNPYIPTMENPIPRGTETILLVDDDEVVRELGTRFLNQFGYRVITADDGNKALEIFQREGEGVSLVILDLIMPVMDGKKCLEEILRINPNAKVVMASGHSESRSPNGFIKAGAKGYIQKPYEMRQLLTTIREILNNDLPGPVDAGDDLQ